MRVRYSREQLSAKFAELDAELLRLAAIDAPEEDLWAAFEQLVHVPTSTIEQRDRRWWWEQAYGTMERHGLTALSRLVSETR